jgi:hypothetical protein
MEKLIKQKLTDRGFTKEIILNNRGLINAVIKEVKAAISITRCCTEVCESCKKPKEPEAEKYCHYCNSIESI